MSQTFTVDEVKQNNGKDGRPTWIIIKGAVYDVTNYMKDHPGGPELIADWAGKDCTKDFEDFGHSSDAKKIMKTLKVGDLIKVSQVNDWLWLIDDKGHSLIELSSTDRCEANRTDREDPFIRFGRKSKIGKRKTKILLVFLRLSTAEEAL